MWENPTHIWLTVKEHSVCPSMQLNLRGDFLNPAIALLGIYPRDTQTRAQVHLDISVHCSTDCNSDKMGKPPVVRRGVHIYIVY